MGEAAPPRNRDQDIPTRSGEEMGKREPLVPQPESDRKEQDRPLPEEETYERGHEERRPDLVDPLLHQSVTELAPATRAARTGSQRTPANSRQRP